MLWTLFCAEEELEGGVIVSYGDIVYLREIIQ
jgi:choline kinase